MSLIGQWRRLSHSMDALQQSVARRLGLSKVELRCLDHLAQASEGLSAGALARIAGHTTGATTGMIDRLAKAGLVERAPDPADRRRVRVQPVRSAIRKRLVPARQRLDSVLEEVAAGYDADQQALLGRYLSEVDEALLRLCNEFDG